MQGGSEKTSFTVMYSVMCVVWITKGRLWLFFTYPEFWCHRQQSCQDTARSQTTDPSLPHCLAGEIHENTPCWHCYQLSHPGASHHLWSLSPDNMGWFMIYNWFTVSTHLFRFELYPSDEALFSITTETVLPLTKLTHLGCSLTCLLTSSSDTVESHSVESSVITHISTTRLMLQLISWEEVWTEILILILILSV